jgi:hypothetical protein
MQMVCSEKSKEKRMGIPVRLMQELKTLALVFLYFACWLGILFLIKHLVLAEYHIEFSGVSGALIGALVLSKVVMILEFVPLGKWLQHTPAWVDVVVRTLLYSLGVLVVLLLEKAFEGRHEYGGFSTSLAALFDHPDLYHVWLNLIVVSGALFVYNLLSVINRYIGEGGVKRLLMMPLPQNQQNQ